MTERFKEIPQSVTWTIIEPIHLGWSSDEKFKVTDQQGQCFALRISSYDVYQTKVEEFNYMQRLYACNIAMSKPIAMGTCNHGSDTYILLSWIEGEQAEIVLPTLPEDTQYLVGIEAGVMLKKMHGLKPCKPFDWETLYLDKIDKRIIAHQNCGYKHPIVDTITAIVKQELHLIKNRPLCYHHGDFHTGNLIIDDALVLHAIDFNRHEVGDPYYEFNRLFISSHISPSFAKGQIDGYFDYQVPDDFFTYLRFYAMTVLMGTIPWALKFKEEDLEYALDSLQRLYDDYQGFTSKIPLWYK